MEDITDMATTPNTMYHVGEENFKLFDEIPISTIGHPKRRFQAASDISLPAKLIWQSHRPKNKALMKGASPGISYELS